MTVSFPRRTPLLALVALALAVLGAPAAQAGCGGPESVQPRHPARGGGALAIGDSTMLLSLPALAREGFQANAMGCREWFQGMALLRSLSAAGALPHLVVFALGANAQVTGQDIDQALHLLGPHRVFVVVSHFEPGHVTTSDLALERHEAAERRIHLLDWVAYSAGHGDWFGPDGLHLTLAGAAAFARLLKGALAFSGPTRVTLTLSRAAGALRLPVPLDWTTLMHRHASLTVRTAGSCGYRVTFSASLSARAGGAGAAVAALPPAGARVLSVPRLHERGAASTAWTIGASDEVGGAWALPSGPGTLALLIASGYHASTCGVRELSSTARAVAGALAATTHAR
ncbi:MAG TPA: hypothetical protein VHX88_20340 [Solirubrobacteraceae bacterium]|jgi:hypothetical protein|nr:hypothetical protein [Solirubrobacteraceae bacterium]